MKKFKIFGSQFLINFFSIGIWEWFLRNFLIDFKTWITPIMESASIFNPWFLLFILSVNLLCTSILLRKRRFKQLPVIPARTSQAAKPLSQADKDRLRASEINRLNRLIKDIEEKIAVKQAKGEYFSVIPGVGQSIVDLLEKKKKYVDELEKLESNEIYRKEKQNR